MQSMPDIPYKKHTWYHICIMHLDMLPEGVGGGGGE